MDGRAGLHMLPHGPGCCCMAQIFRVPNFWDGKTRENKQLVYVPRFLGRQKTEEICGGDAKDFKEAAARAGYAVRVSADAVDGRAGLHMAPHGPGCLAAWLRLLASHNFGTAIP